MKSIPSLLLIGLATVAVAQSGTQQVSDAKLKKLAAEYKTAKAAYDKKPNDAKVKKSFENAAFGYGLGCMYSESMPAKDKYRAALEHFRETLKVNPKHKLAKENYDMIAQIYRQMGRPVPGEKSGK